MLTKVKNVLDITADTVADLASAKHKTGSVQLLGFHTKGDGGGGVFYWDASKDKADHNGGTVIDPDVTYPTDWDNQTQLSAWFTAGSGAGCWVRQATVKIDVRHFGAKIDGDTDDKLPLTNAAIFCANSQKTLAGEGVTMLISDSVDLTGIANIDFKFDIKITTGTVTVGSAIGNTVGVLDIYLQDVTNGANPLSAAAPASPVLKLTGAVNSRFNIGACNYLQLYADSAVTANRLFAYNQLFIIGAVSLLEITDSGAAVSYVNENTIHASRIVRYKVLKNGYAHNHNKLYNPTFEGSTVEIEFTGEGVSANRVYGARFEGVTSAPGVTFGADTYSNTIEFTWSGVGNPRASFDIPVSVSDSGMGNSVASDLLKTFKKTPVFSIDGNSQILATATKAVSSNSVEIPYLPKGLDVISGDSYLTPGLKGVYSNAYKYFALSDPLPVSLGDVMTWDTDFDGSIARPAVFVLDSNLNPLLSEGADGGFISAPGYSFNTTYGKYVPGANLSSDGMLAVSIVRPEVAYIRVGFYLGVTGFVRKLGANLYTKPDADTLTLSANTETPMRSLNGIPTKGFAKKGTLVYNTVTSSVISCTYQHETFVNGAVAAGGTSVTVDTIHTVANGDIVGILLDNEQTHWTTVSALVGSTFTIDAIPAGTSVLDNAKIVFNRWA